MFLTIKLYLCYTELFLNRTDYLYKNGFGIKFYEILTNLPT